MLGLVGARVRSFLFERYEARRLFASAPPAGLRWIEVGSGSGCGSRGVLRRFLPASLTVTDPDPLALRSARSFLTGRGVAVEFREASMDSLPYPADAFDAGLAVLSLHHAPEPGLALREIARVIRQSGRLYVEEATRSSRLARRHAGRSLRILSLDGWVDAIEAAGFSVTRTTPLFFGTAFEAERR